jgi:hypothetical protein
MKRVRTFAVLAGAAALVACATQATDPSLPSGYRRVVTAQGAELFCRSDLDAGSHVQRTTVCLTAAELKASQENSQDFITDVQGGSKLSGAK